MVSALQKWKKQVWKSSLLFQMWFRYMFEFFQSSYLLHSFILPQFCQNWQRQNLLPKYCKTELFIEKQTLAFQMSQLYKTSYFCVSFRRDRFSINSSLDLPWIEISTMMVIWKRENTSARILIQQQPYYYYYFRYCYSSTDKNNKDGYWNPRIKEEGKHLNSDKIVLTCR